MSARRRPRRVMWPGSVLGAIEVLPFEEPADAVYGVLRARLEQKGQPMGGNVLEGQGSGLPPLMAKSLPPLLA